MRTGEGKMNDSKTVIADNIIRIKSMRAVTLSGLSDLTGIGLATLKSWSRCKSYPRLKTLDAFCDGLQIHTSDMLEEGTRFSTPYTEKNDSHRRFFVNFIDRCNALQLINDAEKLAFFNDDALNDGETDRDVVSSDALSSYRRRTNGRQIPIKKLDFMADRFGIKSFTLLR